MLIILSIKKRSQKTGNPLSYNSFLEKVIPYAQKKRVGIIGMKVYFRGLAKRLPWFDTMEPFFHFALSQSITTAVIGCDSILQLVENVQIAARFSPMSDEMIKTLIRNVTPFARRLMYYKH